MIGLYGTLNLGTRALLTQSQGISVAGQNLANVNNSAYSRQRLVIQTTDAISTSIGSQGTGASAVSIQRVHDSLLDRQIQNETGVTGFWNSEQKALLSAQTNLGEALNSSAQGANGTTITGAVGAQSTLASDLSKLFTEFQNLAATPSSLSQRSVLLSKAQNLADQFNQTDSRLSEVNAQLNESVTSDVSQAADLLKGIAGLNEQIRRAEASNSGSANDLRDLRQQKLETLAGLTNLDAVESADGQVNISIGGNLLVSGKDVVASLETYDAGGGQLQVRTTTGTALTLTSGSIQGSIDARDGALAKLRTGLDKLANTLVTEVNTVHRAGYNLNGGTGADFFSGTSAATISVNSALTGNPALIQASGNPAAVGDNKTAVALAALADKTFPALGGQTFAGSYASTVSDLGESLSVANAQVEDQQLVADMLKRQRNAVSGVSIDEEMADLVKFQKAFQASARIISTVDEMLTEVINMKR